MFTDRLASRIVYLEEIGAIVDRDEKEELIIPAEFRRFLDAVGRCCRSVLGRLCCP